MPSCRKCSATRSAKAHVQSDLLFCNVTEAMAVAGEGSAEEAFAKLKDIVPNAVVTDGPSGAFVRLSWRRAPRPGVRLQAGGRDRGRRYVPPGRSSMASRTAISPEKAARAANFLAMKVITQVGARLHHGAKQLGKATA